MISCNKEFVPTIHEVTFAGNYSLDKFYKTHCSAYEFNHWFNREAIINGTSGTDYHNTWYPPDSGGPGGTIKDTFDISVVQSNVLFTDDYQWDLKFDIELRQVKDGITHKMSHKLAQAGHFEIYEPLTGSGYDFRLKMYFTSYNINMHRAFYDEDDLLIHEYVLPTFYGEEHNLINDAVFNVLVIEEGLKSDEIDYKDCCEGFTQGTFMLNEGLVNLSLKLK